MEGTRVRFVSRKVSYNSNYYIICYCSRRQEREMIAAMGVPEVWGLSPPRPEIE